jgi:hydroxymethylpyrimidine/phosphomethylpyrimidine kinase
MPQTALSIAGSDPSGGAGIQADLKTFVDHKVFGMAVITALTAQNSHGITGVHPVPPEFVGLQVQTLLSDMPVNAIKLGMLANAGIISAVAVALKEFQGPIVLDPVMVSTSGHALIAPNAVQTLVSDLLPLATLLTPNLPEAKLLLDGAEPQAFVEQFGVALLLKDGHGEDQVVRDVLYQPGLPQEVFMHPRIKTQNTHGTGCTLSSALAARLAKGQSLSAACEGGIAYIAELVATSATHSMGTGKNGALLHGL